jgi:hypothetical protein
MDFISGYGSGYGGKGIYRRDDGGLFFILARESK